MKINTIQRQQWISAPLEQVFSFFCEARNLDRITPPELRFKLLAQSHLELLAGTLIDYELAWHGLPMRWTSCIEEWCPPTLFIDVQRKGPYRFWRHTHSFEARDGGTLMRDTIEFAVPFGGVGDLCAGWLVRRDVDRIFDYRAQQISLLFPAEHIA
jgi:ligand-binding SRPBCC domain-containing protein